MTELKIKICTKLPKWYEITRVRNDRLPSGPGGPYVPLWSSTDILPSGFGIWQQLGKLRKWCSRLSKKQCALFQLLQVNCGFSRPSWISSITKEIITESSKNVQKAWWICFLLWIKCVRFGKSRLPWYPSDTQAPTAKGLRAFRNGIPVHVEISVFKTIRLLS